MKLLPLFFLGLAAWSPVLGSTTFRRRPGQFELNNHGADYFPNLNKTLDFVADEGQSVLLTFLEVDLFHQSRRRGAKVSRETESIRYQILDNDVARRRLPFTIRNKRLSA